MNLSAILSKKIQKKKNPSIKKSLNDIKETKHFSYFANGKTNYQKIGINGCNPFLKKYELLEIGRKFLTLNLHVLLSYRFLNVLEKHKLSHKPTSVEKCSTEFILRFPV